MIPPADHLVDALSDQLRGTLAGRYAIERELGRGGMATVYLARDLKHSRPVALKVLHPHLAANVGSDRFLREIEIAARLSHPHILTLIDSGAAGALLYYVMPYVEGESLRSRLEREPRVPLAEALAIIRQVAGALAYAHARGVVHRDIKPENVMLHEGGAIVTDFGIAKALSAGAAESLTQTGTALGTPAYMSPEQAAGESELDGRSDVYSLGCMVFEMLAGAPPFTGPTAQAVMVRRITDSAPSIRTAWASAPAEIDRAVSRALAREPAARFATTLEFAQALAAAPERPRSTPTVLTAHTAGPRSIAVLPFADMSPQKDQDYFCEGIAEEIINALTKIQALRVASRSSAFAFKGKNQDIRQVGEQLGAGSVLEGSVRKAGNRIRITAQLINVSDGYHLWSERYDRELEDVFAVQDEIAENIVRALRIVLTEDEKRAIENPRTENVQAYDYYLRGRQFFHQFREKGIQFARRMFARAIEIDPQFVLAYAGTADCSSFLYMYWDASAANLEQANAASRQALELDPGVAAAHASRGLALTLSKRFDEAQQEFETAIRLDPRLFESYYFYARACFQQGRLDEAAHWFTRAGDVRPEDYQTRSLLAATYSGMGRETEANQARRESVRIIEQHLELNPDDARALYFGAIDLAALGERGRALDWANRALALDPEDSGVLYNVGCVYAKLDRNDEALDCLERAVQNGFGHREWIENDSDLAGLKGEGRFQALLSKL
ncbi:MAG TPA: protein kinase [Gemmatimonadales bacterium]|nr:protein kinase [Gemmatimonadales bacterium]